MHGLPDTPAARGRATAFPETDWELVRSMGGDLDTARQATARLCELYWYPVYAFVRRFSPGKSSDDALELAQEFLTLRVQKNDMLQATPELGRFRAWLLGALRHFLLNQGQYEHRQQRDQRKLVWVDGLAAEERFQLEPRCDADPGRLFERDCAVDVLRRAVARLAEEQAMRGKAAWFEEAKHLLIPGESEASYAALEQAWRIPDKTLKVIVNRLRARLGKLIDEELERRVGAANVAEERRFLMQALSAPRSSA
jgi:RNA polymerase sigma-70 factor (ECF subfamily)